MIGDGGRLVLIVAILSTMPAFSQQITAERAVQCTVDAERHECTTDEKKEARRWVLYAGAVALGVSGLWAAIYAGIKYGLGREQVEEKMAQAGDNFDKALDQLGQAKDELNELNDVQHTEKLIAQQLVAQIDTIDGEVKQLEEEKH